MQEGWPPLNRGGVWQSPRHSAEASRQEAATARGGAIGCQCLYILPGYVARFFQENALEGPKNNPVVEPGALFEQS